MMFILCIIAGELAMIWFILVKVAAILEVMYEESDYYDNGEQYQNGDD